MVIMLTILSFFSLLIILFLKASVVKHHHNSLPLRSLSFSIILAYRNFLFF